MNCDLCRRPGAGRHQACESLAAVLRLAHPELAGDALALILSASYGFLYSTTAGRSPASFIDSLVRAGFLHCQLRPLGSDALAEVGISDSEAAVQAAVAANEGVMRTLARADNENAARIAAVAATLEELKASDVKARESNELAHAALVRLLRSFWSTVYQNTGESDIRKLCEAFWDSDTAELLGPRPDGVKS